MCLAHETCTVSTDFIQITLHNIVKQKTSSEDNRCLDSQNIPNSYRSAKIVTVPIRVWHWVYHEQHKCNTNTKTIQLPSNSLNSSCNKFLVMA